MIRFDKVFKSYRRGPSEVRAVDGVSLELPTGGLAFMLGPSGSGKSTLLHLAGALDMPSGGRIFHATQEITGLGDRELSLFRRHKIGFVFQNFHLLPNLTALENVLMPTVPEGTTDAHRDRALELLAMFGLAQRIHHRPSELSGGECQRVSIARALIFNAPTILADEPTGELDSATGAMIMDTIRKLSSEQGRTVMIVTHDQGLIRDGDWVFRLRDGRVESQREGAGSVGSVGAASEPVRI